MGLIPEARRPRSTWYPHRLWSPDSAALKLCRHGRSKGFLKMFRVANHTSVIAPQKLARSKDHVSRVDERLEIGQNAGVKGFETGRSRACVKCHQSLPRSRLWINSNTSWSSTHSFFNVHTHGASDSCTSQHLPLD